MLNFRINKNNILSDEDRISVKNSKILSIDSFNEESYFTKNSIICYTDKLEKLKVNTQILAYHNIPTSFDDYGQNIYYFNEKYKIEEINEVDSSFSFNIDKYLELPLQVISKFTRYENDGSNLKTEDYCYIYFEEPHFYNIDTENEEQYIWSFYDGRLIKMSGFEIITNSSIRFQWKDIEEKYSFIKNVFDNENNIGDKTKVRFFRENYFFTYIDNFELYYNNPKCVLPIGLTNNFQTDLLKEQTLNDYLVEAKKRSINGIVDMEKDIYYPVSKQFKSNKTVFKPISKIKFNLHFREHRGENWTVESNTNWNGTYVNENGKIQFINNFFSYKNKSEQSDLLTYLNFTDTDVRYQKNKLKKSFLRLSLYDSMNEGNQNLLSYASIFMNSGEYFNKYIRYIDEKPFLTIKYNEDGIFEEIDDLKGIRVNREPVNKKEDIENYRLSSQFVVTDKYNSNASSEGFYFYLWRDILESFTEEQKKNGVDVYMKIEFNHAGFGRTIPFMLPYWDKKKWDGTNKSGNFFKKQEGIKTFEEIIDDWNKENETDGEYGARQYNKFSYIHFKIKYDENEKKYIYFLDDECYGDNSIKRTYDEDKAEFTLNLYEVKMV